MNMHPRMDNDGDSPGSEWRLTSLQREIAAAEATLRGLEADIVEAHSEHGQLAASDARAENKRLLVENLLVTQDAQSAHAALEVALKASQTDALTGLHNRDALWSRLAHDLALARRQGHPLAIYFLDIDDFKKMNDQYGHAAGDQLLQHTARLLVATMRASDTVCRLGGDEFVIVAAAVRGEDASQVVTKIHGALAEPCVIAGHAVTVSASIGYSLFPEDGDAPDVLVHKADEAMYRNKRARTR